MKIRSSKRVLAVITATTLFTGLGVAAFGVDDAKEVRQADFINSLGAGSQGEADVRTDGHYEFLEEGLHVWTSDAANPSSGQNKVAEYFAPRDDNSALPTDASQDFYGTDPEPGKQIVFDVDQTEGNTGPGGQVNDYNILVGEPVYGNDWWYPGGQTRATNRGFTCPETGGGFGNDCHGTLAQWSSTIPSARVYALGFSLGSGVKGDGVLRSQTYNYGATAVEYVFTDEENVAPVTPETHTQHAAVTAAATWNNSNRVARINMNSAPQPANDTGTGTQVKWEIFIDGTRYYLANDGWGDTTTWAYKFGTAGGSVKVELKRNGVSYGIRNITTN